MDSLFDTASQTYREALKQWDHPGIHYNLAIALNHLDNPLEAHKHLVAALKYGGAPLDQKRREDANLRLRNTTRQIATLEVSCQEPDTTVTIDGRETIRAPSRRTEFVLAGKHLVSANRPGYLDREYALVLAPGETKKVEVRLFTEEQLSEPHRPLPFWLPVVVSGTGAVAMAITGVILQLRSNVLVERYDRELAEKWHDNGSYDGMARPEVTDRADVPQNVGRNFGCSADCKSNETCGNGFLDPGEWCDDGNNINGDGCSDDCKSR